MLCESDCETFGCPRIWVPLKEGRMVAKVAPIPSFLYFNKESKEVNEIDRNNLLCEKAVLPVSGHMVRLPEFESSPFHLEKNPAGYNSDPKIKIYW